MTERLTEKFKDGRNILRKGIENIHHIGFGQFYAGEAIDKLSEYETAEEEGRLVVLPCKVGSTVYRILYTLAFGEIGDKAEKHYFIRETSFEYGMIDDLNETVFLTREEAEKALEDMKKDE